eukprot:TRINITY_DN22581_c0_g1_i1.p1 TRINITY_DN22581_c0_g1~~TRINITY_DN22581_c0_g1_i1.p1  ORF type:complete len:120 (-),score=17.44 TRINITY_DN22581_c0_g1_i1:312-671(-)
MEQQQSTTDYYARNRSFPEPKNPDEDLVMYYGKNCRFTLKAIPEVDCLELYLRSKNPSRFQLVKKEIYESPEIRTIPNFSQCGGVPFFHNKRTGGTICGIRPCRDLKFWADPTNPDFHQ